MLSIALHVQAKKKGKVGDWSDDEADPVRAEADSEDLPGLTRRPPPAT